MAEKNRPLVMVVDDNKITVKLVSRYLYYNGYQAVYALDGVDCLEKLNQLYNDGIVVDCLVSDTMMPKMDGYELVDNIRHDNNLQNIGIIVITSLKDVENQMKVITAGADLPLAKPIEGVLLIAQVKVAIAMSDTRRIEALINGSEELIATEKLMAIINKTPYNLPEAWLGWKIEI